MKNGYTVKISNSKDPGTLKETIEQLGNGATAARTIQERVLANLPNGYTLPVL